MLRLVRKGEDGEPELLTAISCPGEAAVARALEGMLTDDGRPERLVPGDVLILDALLDGVRADAEVSEVLAMAEPWEEVDDEEPVAERDC